MVLLDQKLTEAEAARLDLLSNRARLENDGRVKENSLTIDQVATTNIEGWSGGNNIVNAICNLIISYASTTVQCCLLIHSSHSHTSPTKRLNLPNSYSVPPIPPPSHEISMFVLYCPAVPLYDSSCQLPFQHPLQRLLQARQPTKV